MYKFHQVINLCFALIVVACDSSHESGEGGEEKASPNAPSENEASGVAEVVWSDQDTFEYELSLNNYEWHVFHLSKSAGSDYCIVLQTNDGDLDLYGHWLPTMNPTRECSEPEDEPQTCVQHRSEQPRDTQDGIFFEATQDGDYWLWVYAYPRSEYSSSHGVLFASKLAEGADCYFAE